MSVLTPSSERRRFPLTELIRTSSLNVGAAAAAAALRRDLVDTGRLPSAALDEAYAVARVTPGTNLLAMYTLLGERFAGWPGALAALWVGALVPTMIAVALGVAYVEYSEHPLAREAMKGARAGALAAFAWAVVRLLRPQIQHYRGRGIALALATLAMTPGAPDSALPDSARRWRSRCSVPQGLMVNAVVLYFLLLRATALSFSGFASVPLIREDLVMQRAVLSDEELNSAIAISQASPGPLGLYIVVVGYFVAGVPGALAAALALATPAILAIPIARAVRRHRDAQVGATPVPALPGGRVFWRRLLIRPRSRRGAWRQ